MQERSLLLGKGRGGPQNQSAKLTLASYTPLKRRNRWLKPCFVWQQWTIGTVVF
jgi:hypothetical protein